MEETFAWTFPCYAVIHEDCTTDPNTGHVVIDERLRFIAPEDSPAIFTDRDLVESFIQDVVPNSGFFPMEIHGPRSLAEFLLAIGPLYQSM